MVARLTRHWRAHRWRVVAGGLLVTLALLAGLVHTAFVRARVLSWALSSLEGTGLQAAAAQLDYNLFTLTVGLHDVTLTAEGADSPFLSADAIRLDLPWSIVGGTVGIEALEIDRPRAMIVRHENGSLNLPGMAATGDDEAASGPIEPLQIGRLVLRDLDLGYADASASLSVDGRGVTLDMDRVPGGLLAGRLSMSDGVTLRSGDRETTMATLEGGVAFDGTALSVETLTMEAPEAWMRLDGSVSLLASAPRMDLRYEGRLDVERVAPWIGLDPGSQGHITFSGAAQGPLDEPALTVDIASDQLVVSAIGDMSLQARGTMTGSVASVESFRATLAGGEINGDAGLALAEGGSSLLHLRWNDLNLGTLAGLAPDLPIRVASIADGDLALEWTGQDPESAEGRLAARLRGPASPSGALDLSGQLDLALDRGAWTASVDQRIARTIVLRASAGGRLAPDDLAASTLDGRAALHVGSLPDALRRLRAAGVEIDEQLAERVRGAISANLDLGGSFNEPRAGGTLEATELWVDDTGPGTAHAGFAATSRELTIDPLRLDIGPNVVSGSATIGLEANTLRGALTARLPQLALLAGSLPAEWQPDGSADVDAQLGGALDNPRIQLAVSSRDLRVAGQMFLTVQSKAELADQILTVDELELTQDAGRLTAAGRYEIASGRYTFDAAADDLAITPLFAGNLTDSTGDGAGDTAGDVTTTSTIPLEARFDLRLSGDGTIASPQARGFVQFSYLDWDRYRLGSARAEVVLEDGRARLTAQVPSVNATMEATVELEAPRPFTLSAAVIEANLSELVRPSGPAGTMVPDEQPPIDPAELAGALTVRATAGGMLDELAGATVDLDLRLLDVAIKDAPLRLARPARLRYAEGEFIADDVELLFGASRLTARGALGTTTGAGDGLVVRLTGSLVDFVPFVHVVPGAETFEASGAIDVEVRASGSLDAPDIAGEFSVATASFGAQALPPVSDVALQASYAAGLLELSELHATWQGAAVSASGRMPATLLGDVLPERYRQSLPPQDGMARATARIASITPDVLAPFMDPQGLDQMSGRIDAVVTLETRTLDLKDVRAEMTLEQAAMEIARVPLGQLRPTRVRLADGRLDVAEWSWAGAGNRLDVAGNMLLAGDTPQLDLGVSGTLDLRLIGAFAPEVATAGGATLDVTITGPANDPLIEGRVTIADADIIVREPRFAITDLQGLMTLTRDRVELREVTATANGGTVEVAGEIEYPDFALAGGRVTITGRGLAFEIPAHLRTEVDANLTFALSDDTPSLTGSVTILRGSYREPISLTGQLLTGVEEVSAVPEETEPGVLDRVQLGITVVSDEDIGLDNNYGRIDLGSNLTVRGTLGQPVLAGRLTVQEGGEVFLGGQTYTVRRGTVDFTNATSIEPDIDLALETRVQRYDITLEVSGTPATIEAQLRSPGLSQEDVISLLLTGRLAAESTVAQTEVARGQLLMLLSGELLGFAGRAVGLDSVQVSRGLGGASSDFDLLATDTDPSARLTVAKDLRRDVEVVFSQSLTESGDITWIAIYRPLRNVELRGTTEDDNSRAYEFRHEVHFGGGVAPRTGRDSRAPTQAARVTAVRVTGAPGFAEAELRDRLRLEAGDRFDFYRWQQDQDRLVAFYHERGFLEARVAARRQASVPEDGQPGMTLEYEIERGPATTLTIDGFSLPDELIERMEVAWGRAVFDGFLLEDLEAMARLALAEAEYLRAEVTAAVTSSPESGTKVIAVRIVPGTRFDNRRIVFSGNDRLPASVLETIVRTGGLEVTAWLNPDELESVIERQYRSIGNLAVDVTVDPPVFSGQSATLPVRVDEGRQFQIASVEVHGAVARSEAELRTAFGITADSAYLPSLIEPARREVEVGYRQEGFNDVRVSVTTLVDRERARVDVSLTVAEGRQQVLSSIDIAGADVTSRGTIDRALDLETGQPASLTNYYRAQKRLYDTGVFQSADVAVEPVEGAPPGAGNTQPVRASVSLQELPRYRFRYGFRLNDAVGPTEAGRQVRPAFVVDLLRRNLLGRAVSTGAAGQLEADRRLARGFVSLPQVFGFPVTTNLFLTASREDFTPEGSTPFVEDRSDITAEQRFRPASSMAVTWGYSFGRTHAFELDPDPTGLFPPFDVTVNIARLVGTYAWDTRDDPANAGRGWFHSSGLEYASETLGSDLRFVRYLAQQYYFKRLGGAVLASAFRLGVGRGFAQDLIPSEKFFAGGGTSVRGFAEDGLGEVDFFGDPAGGNSLLVLNQEVRFPIYGWLRGVGFVDAGNVFSLVRDLSLSNLEAGAGFGVRIHSPFALVRIDYGMPLTRRQQEPFGRWYFAIGQAF